MAVVVTHDAGPWLEETLRSLAAQSYPNLTVLVIDAASAQDQTDRVRAVLPGAHVRRLRRNPGYGAATNELLGAVRGASYYLLCHDDVALERDALEAMVARAEGSGAGIVGPKLVRWDDRDVLLGLGLDADRTGITLPLVERGELDQAQHDGTREVFAVGGACTLARAELFERLDGFDPAMSYVGEDLDLCWRAQVAGSRVEVAPDARVRHRESLNDRPTPVDPQRLQARHRLRTVLSCYRPLQLLRVLPRLVALTVVGAVAGAVQGRTGPGRSLFSGWWWNLRRLGQIHHRRQRLQSIRTVSDGEVRRRQAEGGARLTTLLRQQIDDDPAGDASVGPARPDPARSPGRPASAPWPLATTTVAIASVVAVVVGARHLLTADLPAVGELAAFPAQPGRLLEQWRSGWRPAGFGSDASPPTALGLLGMAGLAAWGAMDLLRTVLVLGLVPIGAIGACRMAAPFGSRRATLVALIAYLICPVPYNAIARGSWSGLALYAVSPWLLVAFARASRLAPYPSASLLRQILGLGLVVALVGAFVPAAVVVAIGMAVAMAAASLLAGRLRGSLRMLGLALGAGLLALVLNGPWLIDVPLHPAEWQRLAGLGATGGADGGQTWEVLQLSRFWSGPYGSSPLTWGLIAAAAVGLLVARDVALEWAVRGWFVALAGWATLWGAGRGWVEVDLPAAEVLLAPVGAGLALAAAAGATALDRVTVERPTVDRAEADGRRHRPRRGLAGAGLLALFAGALPLGAGLVDGRWGLPAADFGSSLVSTVDGSDPRPSRLLWIGHPDVVGVVGHRLDDDLVLATTTVGEARVDDQWPAPDDEGLALAADHVGRAERGGTSRLGRLLGPMGVRYVVVPTRTAPEAAGGEARQPPEALTALLAAQLDLERVESDPALLVYENRAWLPVAARLADDVEPGDHPSDAVDDPLAAPGVEDALRADGTDGYAGELRAGRLLFATADAGRWRLEVDGEVVEPEPAYGWATAYAVERGGRAELRYRPESGRALVVAGQAILWLAVALGWWALGRRRRQQAPRAPVEAGP